MRVLARNKKDIWYSNPVTKSYVIDNNGFKTGEKEITYGTPVKERMSMAISSGANNLGSQGMVALDPYGLTTAYTHNAITEDMNCPLDEEALVWYERTPTVMETRTRTVEETIDGEVTTHTITEEVEVPVPHNFKVVRKAKSLNHLIYYLKEVDVS
jgi:hypothetical protein